MVDIFESPEFLLSSDFDPYKCSVLGVKLNDSADVLKDWEGEVTSADWVHVGGGVAFHVKDGEIFKIKLPRTITDQLEIRTIEDLITRLGKPDDKREMNYRDRLKNRTYIWNKGISAFWQLVPKIEPGHLTIFDPARGYEAYGPFTFTLLLAQDCLGRQPAYQVPPPEERECLRPDDAAKLIFEIKVNSQTFTERMWVDVVEVRPEYYQGRLINDAFCTHDLKRGESIQFHTGHIIQILRKEDRGSAA